MPDDLYARDALAWSEQQADLLRRVARGERVNGVDWDHVVEEIEDVGLSELHAVESLLHQMLVHLLRVHCWPAHQAAGHWRGEIVVFQKGAARRFAPSMQQRIDLPALYADACEAIADSTYDGQSPGAWPSACPFTLGQLLTDRRPVLEALLVAGGSSGTDRV
jgi:hypothetical protein